MHLMHQKGHLKIRRCRCGCPAEIVSHRRCRREMRQSLLFVSRSWKRSSQDDLRSAQHKRSDGTDDVREITGTAKALPVDSKGSQQKLLDESDGKPDAPAGTPRQRSRSCPDRGRRNRSPPLRWIRSETSARASCEEDPFCLMLSVLMRIPDLTILESSARSSAEASGRYTRPRSV